MIDAHGFFRMVIDTVSDHIAVIGDSGDILFVNQSWINFGRRNDYPISDWSRINYLEVCEKSADMGDEFGKDAATGIADVISSKRKEFYFEYPCHSDIEKRWFMMKVVALEWDDENYYVISHQNITKRKLSEENAFRLARLDGLTGVPNRRYLDEFINTEWRRCIRLGMPISLAIIDLDNLKTLNDTCGHMVGDDCLKILAKTLNKYANRPSDMCARYGGDEFALVFGNADLKQSFAFVQKIMTAIRKLSIPNERSASPLSATVSIGLATMYPDMENDEGTLAEAADQLLYTAKRDGRDRIACGEISRGKTELEISA